MVLAHGSTHARAACLLASSLCVASAFGATLLPDALLCDRVVPLALVQQYARETSKLPASEVLRRVQIAVDALQADARATTVDLHYKPSVALFKGTLLLEKCESSGETRLKVAVVESWPRIGVALVTVQLRGVLMSLYTESALLID